MDTTPFDLTPEQQGLLTSLARETGKPIPTVLTEALAVFQAHERLAHAHGTPPGQHEQETAAPAAEKPARPFWHKALDASRRIPEEELERLPPDLAAQVDHYLSGTPKR
jgi:hypothetical protein